MATTTICGMLSGAFAVSALAPTAALAQDAAPAAAAPADDTTTVVVTGSIIRKKALTSISPLTVTSAADYEKRGITTIDQAAQHLSGNNGGAITNNWSTFGFSTGASGLSLRGLTSNSTLILVDGMREAYYPLGDDATRNFVDLNTIPDATIDRIETLQDGASSTYGADAIAGVVNVITKKTFNGFTGKIEGGSAEKGFGGHQMVSGIWGKGNLNTDGYNFYVSAEYQKDDLIKFADTDYPYNTADQSKTCNADGTDCRTNGVANGIQFDDTFAGVGTTQVAHVRPYSQAFVQQGAWQEISPSLGCGKLSEVTITAHEAIAGVPAGTKLCQQDLVKDFGVMQPEDTRKSLSARVTKRFSDDMEGYASVNWYQNDTYLYNNPSSIRAATTPGAAGSSVSTAAADPNAYAFASGLYLPVYVCPRDTVGACTASNGTLNPNNPFATAGNIARITYRLADINNETTTQSRTLRFAAGLTGSAAGWNYDIGATAMKTNLDITQKGRIFVSHLIDVVKDGSYNFMDPSKNSQAVRDYLSPTNVQKSTSELDMLQVNASRDLMDLGGGSLSLGLTGQIRYEAIDNPSANPDPVGGDPTERYFTINPFGATGSRTITALAFELDAPFTPNWTVNISGREDRYSTGFSAFSPKFSTSYKFLDGKLTLRGTFSRGFRAPSIAETNSDPSTGFVTLNAPDWFIDVEHARVPADPDCNTTGHPACGNGYGVGYSLGLTTIAAKDLKPEKSKNTTVGFVWQPTKSLGFTFDYYQIHKSGVIAGANYAPAIDAYFNGDPIPAGFTITPGAVDPLLPNAMPTPGFIQYGLQNLNAQDTAGMDASVIGRFDLGWAKWTTTAEATYMQYYTQTYNDGTKQRYDGTLGNNQITSGSGTPKLRWNWQNNLDFGKLNVSATAYYISGYKAIAMDAGDTDYNGTCDSAGNGNVAVGYRNTGEIVKCNTDSFVDVDMHASYQINQNYSLYLDVLNVFGTKAPEDPNSTYGLTNYNAAFHSAGVINRYFKVGAKVNF